MLKFLSDTRGSASILAAAALTTLVAATGAAVDYSRMVEAKANLQDAVDAATLAAARTSDPDERQRRFATILRSNTAADALFSLRDSDFELKDNGGSLVGTVETKVKMVFGLLDTAGNIEASASVGLAERKVEIALVVDVSSSMIEEGRFDPAKRAIKAFTARFAGIPNTRIALVPFSSRVNYGLTRQSLFGAWNGAQPIPERWLSPDDHYNDNYVRRDWIDNETFAMTREMPRKRIDWMGCAEPWLDIAVERANGPFVPSEAPPAERPLVAMDHNPAPGKTFCPPPIEALTADFARIDRAADALTSQGSTRLDAGMEAGWQVLSPRWDQAWGSEHVPGAYGDAGTIKVLVFMTDGQMNTMDDPANPNEYDWACKGSEDCDVDAEAALMATCEAIKETGITIHTVSYDEDADEHFMQSCASMPGAYHKADSTSGKGFIEDIYLGIADRILSKLQVLTN